MQVQVDKRHVEFRGCRGIGFSRLAACSPRLPDIPDSTWLGLSLTPMPCGQKHSSSQLATLEQSMAHLKLLTGALPPPGMLNPGCPSFWGWCSCPGMTSRWFWVLRFWLWLPPLLPLPGMNRLPLSPPEPPPRHTVAFRPACSLFSVHEHGCCMNNPVCMAALHAKDLVGEFDAVSNCNAKLR